MKEMKISKSSSSFARNHNIKVSSYRQLSNFVKNIDSDYLEENGETECLSFLFDIVEGSKDEYGNLLLNELRYLFDNNDELVGCRIMFNMLLNRELNDMVVRSNFKRINKMINVVSRHYIENKSYLMDYNIKYFNSLNKMIRKYLKTYIDEYMDGDGGYHVSYSIDGLKKIFINVIKEFIMFNTGIYKQILNYQIDKSAVEKYKERYLDDFEDMFSKKLEEIVWNFENTVDSEVYDYGTTAEVEKYEHKMSDVSVNITEITQAYVHLIDEINSFKITKEMLVEDMSSEAGFYKISKYIEKESKQIIESFIQSVEIELNSYIDEADLTLDVLSCEYAESIISNVIFTLVLNNVIMFIHTEPLTNRAGKSVTQRLLREVGFLNLMNDSLDIEFDINTDDYIRTDWCE